MANAIRASDLAPGVMMALSLHDVPVVVANVGGTLKAISDACSHCGTPLSLGKLEGGAITCAQDGSQFDLASGRALKGPATKRVRTYYVHVEGDEVRI